MLISQLPEDVEMAWRYELQLFTEGSPVITLPSEPALESVVDVDATLRAGRALNELGFGEKAKGHNSQTDVRESRTIRSFISGLPIT